MPLWLLIIVLGLACYRATRFVTKDDFPPIRTPREWIAGDGADPGTRHAPEWLAELVTCPWCASGWITAAAVALTDWRTSVPLPVFTWGAVWALTALTAHLEPDSAGYRSTSGSLYLRYEPVSTELPPIERITGTVEREPEDLLAELISMWGVTRLVRESVGALSPERRNAVLAASAEWYSRRTSGPPPVRSD